VRIAGDRRPRADRRGWHARRAQAILARATVRLGIEGEIAPTWLGSIDGVAALRPGAGFAEIELMAGVEPRDILAATLERGALVSRFEVAEPSLEAIFVELVGRPSDVGEEAVDEEDAA
jgi:ABC-type uncharacterized transport system ATPase subunit